MTIEQRKRKKPAVDAAKAKRANQVDIEEFVEEVDAEVVARNQPSGPTSKNAHAGLPDALRKIARVNLPSAANPCETKAGGSGLELTKRKSAKPESLKEQFRKLSVGGKVGFLTELLAGESPQALNAVTIAAIRESNSLTKIVDAIGDEFGERREALTHEQAVKLLSSAPLRVKQALARSLAPELMEGRAIEVTGVKATSIRSLADIERLRRSFFMQLVFGDQKPSPDRFRKWLRTMANKEVRTFQEKKDIAAACNYWASEFGGHLHYDRTACGLVAQRASGAQGGFIAKALRTREVLRSSTRMLELDCR